MKRIFVIDWIMIATFVPCFCSGIGLHVAGHVADHGVWHAWAVSHAAASLLFLIASILHVRTHRGWYRSLARSGMGRKSRVTAVLSAVFVFVAVTGILLLGVEGAGSPVGMGHYRAGVAAGVLAAGHLAKRIPLLRRGSARE